MLKKLSILLFIVFSFLFAGCESNMPDPLGEGKSVERKSTYKIQHSDGTVMYARHFMYKGHKYIEFFRNMPSYDNYTGYVHDPDCQCMKK